MLCYVVCVATLVVTASDAFPSAELVGCTGAFFSPKLCSLSPIKYTSSLTTSLHLTSNLTASLLAHIAPKLSPTAGKLKRQTILFVAWLAPQYMVRLVTKARDDGIAIATRNIAKTGTKKQRVAIRALGCR